MTIETLVKLVPPPAKPDEPFSGPWEEVEAELGTPLPQDYKDFVRLYGCGLFMDFLTVHVPRCRSPYVRLEAELRAVHQMLRKEDVAPYPLWPTLDGLILFGSTDYGDQLFWLARGALEDWDVVVWGRGMGELEVFDCGLADFLVGLATGQIIPDDFPGDLPGEEPDFKPFSYWTARDRGAVPEA